MRLSLKWIKDYVELPRDLEISKLVHDLTMSAVEVEGYSDLAKSFDKMIVGIIKEVLPHPDANKLRICKVDIGKEIKEIVCGGSNLEVGMKVVVALPGSVVRWHGEGEPVTLEIAKVRGVESYGMICASTEVGISDLFPNKEETEIVDLSHLDVDSGTPLAEALGLDDTILEIDNKSLTNRPDLWGHYGIARELSAIYNLPFIEIKPYVSDVKSNFKVNIENKERCPRYIGVKIEGVKVLPAPFEIQKRIWSVGMRPINALVDVTNYVMLATGQPTHAFDYNQLIGEITVRSAKKDEKLVLLDNKELVLDENDLVITDPSGPIALAGVMGGKKDSILNTTTNIILELANFDAKGIRHTEMRYDTRTEAAIRFEKGIDPERCDIALPLAMNLLKEIYPELIVTGFDDNFSSSKEKKEIELSLNWLEKRLGKRIPNNEIEAILIRLGFEVQIKEDNLKVVVPSWRATGDVSLPEDVLEEIARIYGFENFEAVPITISLEKAINQTREDIDRKIKEYLANSCGMQEIFTYPWVSSEYLKVIFPDTKDMLSLVEPPTPEEKYIRSSHIPNLCKAVSENLRYYDEFSIFESAQIFFDKEYKNKYSKEEYLPLQRKNLAGAVVDSYKNVEDLFRRVKGVIENLPRYIHIEDFTLEQREKPVWADNVVWLNIYQKEEKIGNVALLLNKIALDCGIKNKAVMIFEIDVDSLKPLSSRTNVFKELSEYQMTDFDLSLIVEEFVTWADIKREILANKNDLLRDLTYVGEYKGSQVPSGSKSITLRLVIGSLEKTLTSSEIEAYTNGLINKLSTSLGATLRK